MVTTFQNLLKSCLIMAVVAVFSSVGFTQQVVILPSQSISVSDDTSDLEANSIEIATQNILPSENFTVSVSIQFEVLPVISSPVIKVDNVLYATDGELIYKKEQSQEKWVVSTRHEQPVEISSAFSQPKENVQSDLPLVTDSNVPEPAGFQLVPDFSGNSKFGNVLKTELPPDFPFQFSQEITSLFFQDESLSRLDVILGSDFQITFVKEGSSWVTCDWFYLGSSDPVQLNTPSRAGPHFLFDGFLSSSFSFLRNSSVTTVSRINGLELPAFRVNRVPELNHIASGWTPTIGSVYDRNAGYYLIFCSNLQTFPSLYTANLNFDNSISGIKDKITSFSTANFEDYSSSGKTFKGILT